MQSIATRCHATGALLLVALLLSGSVTGCAPSNRVASNAIPYDRTLIPVDGPTSNTLTSSPQTIGGKGRGVGTVEPAYTRAAPPTPAVRPAPPPPRAPPPPPPPHTPHSPR